VTHTLGSFGEAWAVGFLCRSGHQIVARNVRFRVEEIDIVARDRAGTMVFVEVKCRRTSAFGMPEESITPSRFEHLAAAVEQYIQDQSEPPTSYRVDVIAIEVGPGGRVRRHEHILGVEAPRT
jgi:putative endonuclease